MTVEERTDGRVENRRLAVEDGRRKGALREAALLRDAMCSFDVVEVVWWCCFILVTNAPQEAANAPEGRVDAIFVT